MTTPSPRGHIAATVAGRAIEAEMVEARLAAVARGPMGAWLPASGVEDRRWRRWMAQLLVTEAVVWSEAEAEFDHDNPVLPSAACLRAMDHSRMRRPGSRRRPGPCSTG